MHKVLCSKRMNKEIAAHSLNQKKDFCATENKNGIQFRHIRTQFWSKLDKQYHFERKKNFSLCTFSPHWIEWWRLKRRSWEWRLSEKRILESMLQIDKLKRQNTPSEKPKDKNKSKRNSTAVQYLTTFSDNCDCYWCSYSWLLQWTWNLV